VAVQLARLGVGRLLLVDDDAVSGSNLTRIHEATRADVGRAKARSWRGA
jgi:molybdopterin/thiamine biosynthesis adenylyltransferase